MPAYRNKPVNEKIAHTAGGRACTRRLISNLPKGSESTNGTPGSDKYMFEVFINHINAFVSSVLNTYVQVSHMSIDGGFALLVPRAAGKGDSCSKTVMST
jgi:hypothetical protein